MAYCVALIVKKKKEITKDSNASDVISEAQIGHLRCKFEILNDKKMNGGNMNKEEDNMGCENCQLKKKHSVIGTEMQLLKAYFDKHESDIIILIVLVASFLLYCITCLFLYVFY